MKSLSRPNILESSMRVPHVLAIIFSGVFFSSHSVQCEHVGSTISIESQRHERASSGVGWISYGVLLKFVTANSSFILREMECPAVSLVSHEWWIKLPIVAQSLGSNLKQEQRNSSSSGQRKGEKYQWKLNAWSLSFKLQWSKQQQLFDVD